MYAFYGYLGLLLVDNKSSQGAIRLQKVATPFNFTRDLLSSNEIPIIEGLVQTRKTYDIKVSFMPKSDI